MTNCTIWSNFKYVDDFWLSYASYKFDQVSIKNTRMVVHGQLVEPAVCLYDVFC